MVKVMLGKTQQGKKEVRALATGQAEQESYFELGAALRRCAKVRVTFCY